MKKLCPECGKMEDFHPSKSHQQRCKQCFKRRAEARRITASDAKRQIEIARITADAALPRLIRLLIHIATSTKNKMGERERAAEYVIGFSRSFVTSKELSQPLQEDITQLPPEMQAQQLEKAAAAIRQQLKGNNAKQVAPVQGTDVSDSLPG